MDIPKQPRYDFVIRAAKEFLAKEKIKTFPYDLFDIAKRNGWAVGKYTDCVESQGVSLKRICETFMSDEGACIYDNGDYFIFYNDTIECAERIRFTLAHEIGHIVLGHLYYEETKNHGSKNEVLEKEANAFARNILAPAPIVHRNRHVFDCGSIAQFFSVSQPVAQIRLNLLENDIYYWRLTNGELIL